MKITEEKFKNIVIVCLLLISSCAILYFYLNGDQHLLYGDALSRLNIARKLMDNLTPGFAQLGNVWLPLPQVLMSLFTWNFTLWQTGLAGTIVSTFFTILGGYYIYQTLILITRSRIAGVFGSAIFALNINILYMQTTAMSESIFVGLSMLMTYLLLKWLHTKQSSYLILAAVTISGITLTRYEGLALLATSILIVPICSAYIHGKKSKVEGDLIMFSTLACFGFGLWTIYLTLIFGDPLYWKNYYADTQVTNIAQSIPSYAENINFFEAVWKYFTAAVWMNGLIPMMLSFIGVTLIILRSIKLKSVNYIPLVLPFSISLFMVLTLMRNTPIDQPELTMVNILSTKTSYLPEFNIRYGLLLLPWVAVFCGFIFSIKFLPLKILLILLMLFQFQSYFTNNISIIYQIPRSISGNNTQGTIRDKALLAGMKEKYNGGLMMISALKHDPQMFQMGIDYKNFIHEGTDKYWKKSITDPQVYAKWISLDINNPNDQVTKFLKDSPSIKNYYDLVYEYQGMQLYKIRTAPEIPVPK